MFSELQPTGSGKSMISRNIKIVLSHCNIRHFDLVLIARNVAYALSEVSTKCDGASSLFIIFVSCI